MKKMEIETTNTDFPNFFESKKTKKKGTCIECKEYDGEFKIIMSREFKKEYKLFKWRSDMNRGPFCLSCIHTLLSGGGIADWIPVYIKKVKRIRTKKIGKKDDKIL